MKLGRTVVCQRIEIWQPRWKDRKVLIATHKVGTHNAIVFTKTKSMPGEYYISGAKAKTFPVGTNGTLKVYEVPMDEIELLERV